VAVLAEAEAEWPQAAAAAEAEPEWPRAEAEAEVIHLEAALERLLQAARSAAAG
jgi:hypothetical protein